MRDGEAFHISVCNTSVLVEFLRTVFFSFKLKNEGKTQQAGGKKASCKTTGRFQRRETWSNVPHSQGSLVWLVSALPCPPPSVKE